MLNYIFVPSSAQTFITLFHLVAVVWRNHNATTNPSIPLWRIMHFPMPKYTPNKEHFISDHVKSIRHPIPDHITRIMLTFYSQAFEAYIS